MDTPLHHRSSERQAIKARLLAGVSLLMLAPRRIGKTWLMGKIEEDMIAADWRCIRIDVEGCDTEEEFLRELCAKIEEQQQLKKRVWSHISQRLKQASVDGVGEGLLQSIGRVNHHEFLETLVDALNREEGRTLILIDEIALLVLELAKKNPDASRNLLYHLRKLQQSYPNVIWYFTGSIGLDVIARRFQMSGALLGVDVIPLDPFSPAQAGSFLNELVVKSMVQRPFTLPPEALDTLVAELGWLSPYYLRQLAQVLDATGPVIDGLPSATAENIEAAFDALLSPRYRSYFAAWEEHIDKNFEAADSTRLHAILDTLCAHPTGEKESTIAAAIALQTGEGKLREHLRDLESDGYLVRNGDRWAFRSGLLRRFWLEYKKP